MNLLWRSIVRPCRRTCWSLYCSAIKRGAFTGAMEDRPGVFDRTGKGTLFLDEIGDISPALQVRLLRVLQEHEYEAVGSNRTRKSEARIIAATHRNLKDQIAKGLFREDLYYRLNVVSIELPPLRKRVEDIPDLADLFIRRFNLLHNKDILGLKPDALDRLLSYSWPGNIRELENMMERACILCAEEFIGLSCLPRDAGEENKADSRSDDPGSFPLAGSREELEIREIRGALEKTRYNKQAAADLLGIHKTTLFRKLKKYNLQ